MTYMWTENWSIQKNTAKPLCFVLKRAVPCISIWWISMCYVKYSKNKGYGEGLVQYFAFRCSLPSSMPTVAFSTSIVRPLSGSHSGEWYCRCCRPLKVNCSMHGVKHDISAERDGQLNKNTLQHSECDKAC